MGSLNQTATRKKFPLDVRDRDDRAVGGATTSRQDAETRRLTKEMQVSLRRLTLPMREREQYRVLRRELRTKRFVDVDEKRKERRGWDDQRAIVRDSQEPTNVHLGEEGRRVAETPAWVSSRRLNKPVGTVGVTCAWMGIGTGCR